MHKTNIVLVGMPSTGKTTVGRGLADSSGKTFADVDDIMLRSAGKPLREIVESEGLDAFLRLQEKVLCETELDNHIIATGGSAVYSHAGMMHLKKNSVVIYLRTPLEELEKRLGQERRLARTTGQSLEEVYLEREALYREYADFTVDCSSRDIEDIVREITDLIGTKM